MKIYIWELVPFEPNAVAMRHYEDLKGSIRARGILMTVQVERDGDRYKVVSGHWRVIASRAVGLYRIFVHVTRNPCGEIPLE